MLGWCLDACAYPFHVSDAHGLLAQARTTLFFY